MIGTGTHTDECDPGAALSPFVPFEPRHENKSCSAFPEDQLKSF